MPKRAVTMVRNGASVTIAGITGHDAETAGHDAPKYAVDGLTEGDVAKVIAAYDEEDGQNDYGFKFTGEGAVHWLGKEVARETLSLDVTRLNPEMLDPESLLHELDRHRRQLIALLQ